MGRPLKTKVTETSANDIVAVVDRVAKKLKSFSMETLYPLVVKSFQKTEDVKELSTLEVAVTEQLTAYGKSGKYSVANGVYTLVPGKRGRPRKTVEAVAAQ